MTASAAVAGTVALGALGAVLAALHGLARAGGAVRTKVTVACALAYALAWLVRPAALPISDLAVLAGAVASSLVVSAWLTSQAAVVVFCAAAAAVDLWSVASGPTRAALEIGEPVVRNLAVVWPVGGGPRAVVGIADLVVAGASFAALARLGLRPRWIALALAAGLLAALAFGLAAGGAAAVVFLAAAVVGCIALVGRTGTRRPHR